MDSSKRSEKHEPEVNPDPEPSSYDLSESQYSDSRARKKKSTKKKKRHKHQKDDSSDLSLSDDSNCSDDSHYRRKQRKEKNHRKKDPIRLCATLTANLLTTAYKSKIFRFKMDEDPLQCKIYFLSFIDSLDIIFSQYRETFEVLLDYPKIGGGDVIEDYGKKAIKNLLHDNIDVHSIILISEFPKVGIKCIEKLQSHCANMTFADKSRYDRTFQQVTHKGGGSEIKYIKRFQNKKALSVSVGNSQSEDQVIHTFMDTFHQGGKYSAQLASHQAELRIEETFPDQKCLNISSLQTDYLILDISISGSIRHNEKAHSVQAKRTFC